MQVSCLDFATHPVAWRVGLLYNDRFQIVRLESSYLSEVAMIRFALLFFALTPLLAVAEEPKAEKPAVLKVGDKAPKFEGRTDEDKPWKSAQHVGKKIVVVYFYPADFTGETGGCTKQACSYRDALKDLDPKQVEVIGVSGDTVENHRRFKEEFDLNFTLLADTEGKIAKAFGVKTGPGGVFEWSKDGEKIKFNRGVTTSRWTFVIDRDGKIAYKDEKVDATKDTEKVVKVIEKLEKAKS
jgi:peroxiredoxin Q/BCP